MRLLLLCGMLLFTQQVMAQNFIDFGGKKNPDTSSTKPVNVMSPNDFKTKVNALSKQTNDKLSQETSSLIKSRTPVMPLTPSIPSSSTPLSNQVPPPPATTPATSITPPSAPIANTTEQPVNFNNSPTYPPPTTPVMPPATVQPQQVAPVVPAAANPAPFTGFGGGSNTNTQTPSSNEDDKTWNIQY